MAALANEGANLVWQRVRLFLAGSTGTTTPTLPGSEASWRLFRELRQYLATFYKNPKLQFLQFSDAQVTTAGGVQLGTGKPVVWAVYVMKGSTATASYIKVNDDATDDTTAANHRITLPLLNKGEEICYFSLGQTPVQTAWANGIVVGADTTADGTTDSTAGDAGAGFVIVG